MKLNLLFLRVSANIIDASIIYTLSLIIFTLIPPGLHIGILRVFVFILIVYFLISYVFFNQTPGKNIMQLNLLSTNSRNLTFVDIIKREFLFKYLCGFLLPYALINLFELNTNNNYLIAIAVYSTIFLFFWFLKKEAWWDLLSKIRVERVIVPKKKTLVSYLILLLFLCLSLSFIVLTNNYYQKNDLKIWGFQYPIKFKHYPNDSEVKKYTDFLNEQHLDPKNYVLDLFKTNDIVILCEASHQESTAWDLISEIIADERFIINVGNVFTEYGSASYQSKIDSILNIKFTNDTLLEKSLAELMLYRGPHFFYFLKNINLLNNSLPDSLKIHEYFTDLDYEHEYFPNSLTINDRVVRDSLMAYVIINKLIDIQKNDYRKKCLVITNYRHAFGPINQEGKEINLFNSESYYIIKSFPSRTANVMLNSLSINTSLFLPTDKFSFYNAIQNGKWDRAFEEYKNKPVGFDFKGSPFGKDDFDYFPYLDYFPNTKNIKYEDVFTGFIFNKPYYEWEIDNYYPFREYGAEKEYLEKHNGVITNESELQNAIKIYQPNKMEDKTKQRILYGLLNIIPYVFYFFLLGLGIIISSYHFIRLLFKKI